MFRRWKVGVLHQGEEPWSRRRSCAPCTMHDHGLTERNYPIWASKAVDG